MKNLKESLLDDEDTVITQSDKYIENLHILKLIGKKFHHSTKPGYDAIGQKLEVGDIVISANCGILLGVIFNINENNPNQCNVMYSQKDLNLFKQQSGNYYNDISDDLIKVSFNTALDILKGK